MSSKKIKDSVLFYYYSMPSMPENCFLNLNPNVAYRNMLMFPSNGKDGKIHFEFPVFEDHSYNTICNKLKLKELIRRPPENEKYIIFRTASEKKNTSNIIGYYTVGREFYYETDMWDNYGFVWGIESKNVHLLKKGDFEYEGRFPRSPPKSWSEESKWQTLLNNFIDEVSSRENIADLYKCETERLIKLFKDPNKIYEWRKHCEKCNENCTFKRRNQNYLRINPSGDLISVIHHAHTTNLYSRNELLKLNKNYLRR